MADFSCKLRGLQLLTGTERPLLLLYPFSCFIDHCRISCCFFSRVLIFAVGINREIILTAKFPRSVVSTRLHLACAGMERNGTL